MARPLVSEFVGTALLLTAVVGSGIMGDRLSGGNVAVALLANSIATGAALVVLILTFGPISGAHFNPVVSFADASQGGLSWATATSYTAAQTLGAVIGVMIANVMFDQPMFAWSQQARAGWSQTFSEFVATFGLLATIWSCSRRRTAVVPFAVGAYITAAYWFTPSTSFANPAVTLARTLTNTFTGIRLVDVWPFITAQVVGATAATVLFRWLVPQLPETAGAVVVRHRSSVPERDPCCHKTSSRSCGDRAGANGAGGENG
jgi:glycerol uptake facilitator-like aquaporin